jgi:Lon protease-like protein
MFPLGTVLFPGGLLPLHVFEPRYRAMVADCLAAEHHEFGVVLITRGSEVGGGDTRTDVGTVARIEALSRVDDGRYALLCRGIRRLRVERWLPDDPYPLADVCVLADADLAASSALAEASAALSRVEALLAELGRSIPSPPEEEDRSTGWRDDDPSWAQCRRLLAGPLDRQRLLATDDADTRMALLVTLATDMAEDLVRLLAQG